MRAEIKVPSPGESISEVTVGDILKPTGTFVKQDEEIIEIETDKANQILYAPAEGVITINVKTGDSVKVGSTIGFIDTDQKGESGPKKEEKKELPKEESISDRPAGKIRKKEAEFVEGLSDKSSTKEPPLPVEPKKEEKPSPKDTRGEKREKMTRLRKVIAERLLDAKNSTALLTTFNEVDMSNVIRVRNENKESFQKRYGVKLGFMSFFVKATISALQKVPMVGGRIEGDEIVTFPYSDIGIAVGTDKGLMVPVLRDAQAMKYHEIEAKIKEFSEKARSGKITTKDLEGGNFTISNGGVYGSMLSTPIINPPQSAILGMHAIQERAVVVNGKVEVRPMMYLALSYDHRIVDGKESIEFLVHIKKMLEDPTSASLDG